MKLALVDVETTGGKPAEDRIIDIGIVQIDDYHIVSEWQSLLNPGQPINPFITGLTGIADVHVMDAPSFFAVHEQIESLLHDRTLVAHNARFDYAFIKHEFLRLNKQFHIPQLCTVKLSRRLFPRYKNHGLDAIIDRFQLELEGRHRALPDAKAIYSFITKCLETAGRETVDSAISAIVKRPALPPNVKPDVVQKLPSTVGVYIFYDDTGTPLYVGKSINIKDRILSHFYDDVDSVKEFNLKQTIRHIETRICAGELEALLLESRLVKELMPVFNQQLRLARGLWVINQTEDSRGYYRLVSENITSFDYDRRHSVLAIARSKRQLTNLMKVSIQDHQLCPKLCGIEKGSGACFAYHLSQCAGACIEAEPPSAYNLRVLHAYAASRVVSWPFNEPVIIHEHNDAAGLESFHLIDRWSTVATTRTLDELSTTSFPPSIQFSLDEYKILKTFISKSATRVIPYSSVCRDI